MPQVMSAKNPPISIDPEVMSGEAVFVGTRVPIQTLFDYLIEGCSLVDFLDNFPTVSQSAALAVLDHASQRVANEKAVV
jgi:uncharacterized protein (DUF433 family)